MSGEDARTGSADVPPGGVPRADAVERARRALAERGQDVGGHQVTVTERGGAWLVVFEPPAPAPPGKARGVFVDRETGGTRAMQGE